MYTFSRFSNQITLIEIEEYFGSIDNFQYLDMLKEHLDNIIDKEKYGKKLDLVRKAQQTVIDGVAPHDKGQTFGAKDRISEILGHYGRSFGDAYPVKIVHLGGDFTNAHQGTGADPDIKNPPNVKKLDFQLYKERHEHLEYLKNLYGDEDNHPQRAEYEKQIRLAGERLSTTNKILLKPKGVQINAGTITPYGQNAKTSTMIDQKVNGHSVLQSVSNKGVSGSVTKFKHDATPFAQSTCVNSKGSCHGQGADKIGAPCLGMIGCAAWTDNKISNTVLENAHSLKAHSTIDHPDHIHQYSEDKQVKASPHLDFAALEYDALIKSTQSAHKEHEKSLKTDPEAKPKLVAYRQNTQNERPAFFYDQLVHHLPDHLKKHIATNNYSATIAKGHYDPENPSYASTHDGEFNNTNFSVKGPEAIHDDRGRIVGKSRSGNVQEAVRALAPETYKDAAGNTRVRAAQNAYVVLGGHSFDGANRPKPAIIPSGVTVPPKTKGVRLRYPDNDDKIFGPRANDPKAPHNNPKSDHYVEGKIYPTEAPKSYEPFAQMTKLKTARIYTELSDDEVAKRSQSPEHDISTDEHHPDGYGRVRIPHPDKPGEFKHFDYQDYHLHANAPTEVDGVTNFKTLNDNVGSDDRKPNPKLGQVKKNRKGEVLGSIHVSAATNSTSNVGADGVHVTDTSGKVSGDDNGLALDPFTFPMQHHISHEDETRLDLNTPHQLMAAEKAEKAKPKVKRDTSQTVKFGDNEYIEHPPVHGEDPNAFR